MNGVQNVLEQTDNLSRSVTSVLEPLLGRPAVLIPLLAALALIGLVVSAANSPRRDPDRRLVPSRTVRFPVLATRRAKRIRLPFMVYWPFFGRLYAGVHALICATSGMGKGAALLMWALAYHIIHWSRGAWLRHLILLDPKAELLEVLHPLLNKLGWRYMVYTFLSEHPVSAAINVVATPVMARTTALALYANSLGTEGHFAQKSRQLFLAACKATGYKGLWEVYELLRDAEVLEAAAKQNPDLRRAYSQIQERERSSILSTVTGPLSLLEDPLVARVFSPDESTEQVDFASREAPYAAVICIDVEQGEELLPLVSALADVTYSKALSAGKRAAGRKRGRGVYCYLDEATSFLRIPKLMSYLAVGRGYRTYTAVVSQDISQLEDALGKAKARSSANNAHIKVIGQSDDEQTCRYASAMSGRTRIRYEPPRPEPSFWGGKDDRAPRRIETIPRERLLPHHFQDLLWGEFLVRSRSLGRLREVVRMPDFERYARRIVPRDPEYQGIAHFGVPKGRLTELVGRLAAGEEGLWESVWVSGGLKRLVAEGMRTGEEASSPAALPGPETVGHGSPQGGTELGDRSVPNPRPVAEDSFGSEQPAGSGDLDGRRGCPFCSAVNSAGARECRGCGVGLR